MSQAIEAVLALKKWNQNIVRQLKMISEADKNQSFLVQGNDGRQIEIDQKDVKGLKLGVILALGMIEKFPVKIEANTNNEEE